MKNTGGGQFGHQIACPRNTLDMQEHSLLVSSSSSPGDAWLVALLCRAHPYLAITLGKWLFRKHSVTWYCWIVFESAFCICLSECDSGTSVSRLEFVLAIVRSIFGISGYKVSVWKLETNALYGDILNCVLGAGTGTGYWGRVCFLLT